MKYRKNEPKNSQSVSVSHGEPSRILFLSDQPTGRIAQLVFDAEARKMEVYWIASAFCVDGDAAISNFASCDSHAESYADSLANVGIENSDWFNAAPPAVTVEDLQKANLVVLLQSGSDNSADVSTNAFTTHKGEKEIWTIADSQNSVDLLLQNVKSLLVRLILKGGKRAPVALPPTPANTPEKNRTGSQKSVRVRLESKGRAGKKVTVVFGLEMDDKDLDILATALKQTCGTGGTVKDGTIEIQGDQCERVLAELKRRGMQAKRSGG